MLNVIHVFNVKIEYLLYTRKVSSYASIKNSLRKLKCAPTLVLKIHWENVKCAPTFYGSYVVK